MKQKAFFCILIASVLLVTLRTGSSTELPNTQSRGDEFPRKLWAYWDTGYQNLPTLTKLCIQRMKKILEPKGWTVTLLQDSTLHLYFNYTEYQDVLSRSTSPLAAHRADVIRLSVLEENGGVWVDATSILLQDLDWINNVQNEDGVLNDYGQKADVVMFYTDLYQSSTFYTNEKGNLCNDNPGYESWFIAARAKSEFIAEWKAKMIEYFTGDFCSIMDDWAQNDQYSRNLHTRYYMVHNSVNYVLQNRQRKLDLQMPLFGERITANQYYGILSLDSHLGPLTLRLKYLNEPASIYRYSMMEEFDVEQQIGKTKYFLKLINPQHKWMLCYFNKSMPLSDTQRFVYGVNPDADFTIFPCYKTMFLMKNSIIWKYLINDLDYQGELNIDIITKQQYEEKCNRPEVQSAIAQVTKPSQVAEQARAQTEKKNQYLYSLFIIAVYVAFNCLKPDF